MDLIENVVDATLNFVIIMNVGVNICLDVLFVDYITVINV